MPIRPLAEVVARLNASIPEPEAGDDGIDVRAVVKMQNALDKAMVDAVETLARQAESAQFHPSSFGKALTVNADLPRDGKDRASSTVAIREAQARMASIAGLAELKVGLDYYQTKVSATFKLAPEHPVRQRIAQLLQQKYPPVTEADIKMQQFIADVMAARPRMPDDVVREAQLAMARQVLDGTGFTTTTTHAWSFQAALDTYFPWGVDSPGKRRGRLDLTQLSDGAKALQAAFAKAGVEARVEVAGDEVQVKTSEKIPGHELISSFEPPPGAPRPAQEVIDNAVAGVAAQLDALVDKNEKEMMAKAFAVRFGGAAMNRPSVMTIDVHALTQWKVDAIGVLSVLVEVRRALADAGYDDVKVQPYRDGYNGAALRFSITLPQAVP